MMIGKTNINEAEMYGLERRLFLGKYISIFFLTVMASILLFYIFSYIFMGGGDPAEEGVYTFGTIIVILLSLLISQMFYLINLVKKK